MEDEEFLEEDHAFALAPELPKKIAQPAPACDVKPESFREVFLRVLGSVCADVVRGGDCYTAALVSRGGSID